MTHDDTPQDSLFHVVDCERCNGTGTVEHRTGDLWWQVRSYRCHYCGGAGRVRRAKDEAA